MKTKSGQRPGGEPAGRPGMSLVEVVFTFAMVAGLLGVVMHFFLGTQKQSVNTEARFHSALLAQMVIERVKSQITQNPAFLKELTGGQPTWTSSGTVVDPSSAVAGAGAQLSPFFQFLFAKNGQDAYAPANRVSIAPATGTPASGPTAAEMASLIDNFKDYRVEVKLENDVDLEPPQPPTPSSLNELVKKLTVTVARATAMAAQGKDPNAFTLATRLTTPVESLSSTALDQLYKGFEGTSLDTAWEEFFLAVGDNPYFSDNYLGLDSKRLLADCYLILGTINTEAFLTEGSTVAGNVVLIESQPSQTINGWITLLSRQEYYRHPVFKRTLAKILSIKVKNQFDAFKKILPILQHLSDQHDSMAPRLDNIIAALNEAKQKIIQLNGQTMEAMNKYHAAEVKVADGKKKKDEAEALVAAAEAIIAATAPLYARAAQLKTEADSLKREADTLKRQADQMEATTPPLPQADIDTAKELARKKKEEADVKKQDADRKKEEADKKKEEGEKKKTEALEKKAAAEGAMAAAQAEMVSTMALIQQGMTDFVTVLKGRGEEFMKVVELVTVCKFLADFFAQPTYRAVVDRLLSYPVWFTQALDTMDQTLADHLAQADGATPLDQLMAAHALVETTKIRQLMKGVSDDAALARLQTVGGQYASRMAPLASYLRSGEVHDLTRLKARNGRFIQKLNVLRNLGDPQNPANLYGRVIQLYGANGKVTQFLNTYTQVASEIRLESGSILTELQRQVQTIRQQMAYISNATQEEILQAMSIIKK
ncbi:MAG: hypothetical protein HY815_19415 [Candidatus Riflebacteria bacterium]|nr:hypothetical protein [Candidatus Riflebacteria bacterium]